MQHEVRVYDDPNQDLEDDLRPEYEFDRNGFKMIIRLYSGIYV